MVLKFRMSRRQSRSPAPPAPASPTKKSGAGARRQSKSPSKRPDLLDDGAATASGGGEQQLSSPTKGGKRLSLVPKDTTKQRWHAGTSATTSQESSIFV